MRNQLSVCVEELRGTYYEIGYKQAKSMKKDRHFSTIKQLTQDVNSKRVNDLLKEYYPNFLQELKGMADCLEEDLDTMIRMYSGYNLPIPGMGCTAYAAEGVYVRNYDFSPEIYDARIVWMNPEGGYASVGFSQQLVGRLDGMNEKGLVVGLHFVNQQKEADGFLATTIVRMILDQCKNVQEAVDLLNKIPHMYHYNYSLIDKEGHEVLLEASPQEQITRRISPLICTNHFLSKKLQKYNRPFNENSIARKNYLEQLSKNFLTVSNMYHHFNNEDSPLFFKHYEEYFGTLHTVLYSPEHLQVIIGVGGNCKPLEISFSDWLSGKFLLPTELTGSIPLQI